MKITRIEKGHYEFRNVHSVTGTIEKCAKGSGLWPMWVTQPWKNLPVMEPSRSYPFSLLKNPTPYMKEYFMSYNQAREHASQMRP